MVSILKMPLKAIFKYRQRSFEKLIASDVQATLNGNIVNMVDVGASGGILPRWHPHRRCIAFTGFEPDARSSVVLLKSDESREFAGYKIIPIGVWDKEGKVSISFTQKPMCSSHFKPSVEFLSRFPEFERFNITGSADIDCHTVDSYFSNGEGSIDFMKLDLEGGELAALQGASNVLDTCLGLHVEISFQHLRIDQPLFGEINNALNDKGIEFIDFIYISRWERGSYREAGQAVFGDALFLRSPENLLMLIKRGLIKSKKLKVYLAILLIYEHYDLALKLIDLLSGEMLSVEYREVLKKILLRRKKAFDAQLKRVSIINIAVALLNPNARLHYLY